MDKTEAVDSRGAEPRPRSRLLRHRQLLLGRWYRQLERHDALGNSHGRGRYRLRADRHRQRSLRRRLKYYSVLLAIVKIFV